MGKETKLVAVVLAATTKIGKAFKYAGETVEVTEKQKADFIKKGIVKADAKAVEVVVDKEAAKQLEAANAKIEELESAIETVKADAVSSSQNLQGVITDLKANSAETIAKLEAFVIAGKDTQKNHFPTGWDEYLASKGDNGLLGKQD